MLQGNRTLRSRLGSSLLHEGLVLVSTSQLDQQNLIGSLRCRSCQSLFKLHHILGSVRKGFCEEDFEHRECLRGDMGVLMHQGQHRLGHLRRE